MAIFGLAIIAAYCIAASLLVYVASPSKIATLLAIFIIWISGVVAALLLMRPRQPEDAADPAFVNELPGLKSAEARDATSSPTFENAART
ncbi:MAG: hypothetical protein ACK4MV_17500 [Beijerinckiaceae bacterium]